jgi:serine/threonine-protein kinase HipA
LGDAALEQVFRRMAFNVMARNCDDLTKNFALRLKQGGDWELASAYDVTHAYNPSGEWTYQHLMSVNGKFDDIPRQDFLLKPIASESVAPPSSRNEVRAALGMWSSFARKAGLLDTVLDRVAVDFRSL